MFSLIILPKSLELLLFQEHVFWWWNDDAGRVEFGAMRGFVVQCQM